MASRTNDTSNNKKALPPHLRKKGSFLQNLIAKDERELLRKYGRSAGNFVYHYLVGSALLLLVYQNARSSQFPAEATQQTAKLASNKLLLLALVALGVLNVLSAFTTTRSRPIFRQSWALCHKLNFGLCSVVTVAMVLLGKDTLKLSAFWWRGVPEELAPSLTYHSWSLLALASFFRMRKHLFVKLWERFLQSNVYLNAILMFQGFANHMMVAASFMEEESEVLKVLRLALFVLSVLNTFVAFTLHQEELFGYANVALALGMVVSEILLETSLRLSIFYLPSLMFWISDFILWAFIIRFLFSKQHSSAPSSTSSSAKKVE
ncbi:hypothetical protein QOT17_015748 [Balamuthia mandrillaris]